MKPEKQRSASVSRERRTEQVKIDCLCPEESVPKENVKKPAGPYVLLCPHELLSFPRLQAVVKFPKFKKNEKWIPALTTDVSPYHKCQNSEPCQCYFENDGYAWGYGDIKFWYPGYFDDHPGPHSGVLLESLWVFWLNRFSTALVTVDDVKGFFSHFPVWLCPHKLLIDWVTPERVLTALQNVREKSAYPLETHRREESLANQEKCKKCHTMYICWLDIYKEMLCVKSIRLLGRAKSAKDPIWLSQYVNQPPSSFLLY